MSPAEFAQREDFPAEAARPKIIGPTARLAASGSYELFRQVRSKRLALERGPIPFELVEKLVPNNRDRTPERRPSGIYERILDQYPDILAQTKQILAAVLVVELALFSFLLGDDSSAAIVAGVALFATTILYFVFRSALAYAVGVRSYRISPEHEQRLLSIIDEMARANSRR